MGRSRSWTDEELAIAVRLSSSFRMVLIKLRLIPAGGNYEQVKNAVKRLNLNTQHFTGMGWNKGKHYHLNNRKPLEDLLKLGSQYQSYKLKLRLFDAELKKPKCEMCGWDEMSDDGRIPLELDHINGNRYDNRIENLRILCPNCHCLQPTHRGLNKKVHVQKVT